jgi:uncharacterized protein (DUF1800 family)
MADPSPHAIVAHVLRRLTFGPTPERIDEFAKAGPNAANAAIEWAVAAAPRPILPAEGKPDDWDPMMRGWTDNLRSPESALHEKMTWFWHGHFATSSEKVGNTAMLHTQQNLLRKHAMGNFREFLRAITTDAAMLLYLDLSGSSVEAPNENFAREVMELFALGRGKYSEADVKAGALALAGWEANYDTGEVKFLPERALGGEVTYLGRRGRLSTDDVIDALCRHEACAPFVSAKIYRYLVGVPPTKERLAEIATPFAKDLQIAPLVNAIIRGPDFLSARMNRPKYPVEWWVSALNAIGPLRKDEDQDVGPWSLQQLDQVPHRPPNVAGWPEGPKWLSGSQHVARAAYTWGLSWRMQPIEPNGSDLVGAVLRRASLHEVSDSTKNALHDAATATAGAADALSVSRRLITVATCCPEFGLA